MSIFEQTKELCLAIQNSEEFKNFKEAKEAVLANPESRNRLEAYLELVEKSALAEKNHTSLSDEEKDRLNKYLKTVSFYPDTARFLATREQFFTTVQKIYKMIQAAVQGKEIPKDCSCSSDCGSCQDCGSCH